MGSGIAGAVGLKLAMPRRPVVAVVGDGCFSMGVGDVQTAVQEKLPILVVVLNDHRYGMVELGNQAIYGRTPRYGSDAMSVCKLAEGLGAQTLQVRNAGDILSADLTGLLANGPVVVDVQIDPSVKMPKNKRFDSLASAIGGKRILRTVN